MFLSVVHFGPMKSKPKVFRKPNARHRKSCRAWTRKSLRSLLEQAVLPIWWIDLVLQVAHQASCLPLLAAFEVCSGRGEVSTAIGQIVGPVATFEVQTSPAEDLLKVSGVLLMLLRLLRVKKGGLLWIGPPCSSWITISRSWHRRATWRPAGPSRGSVKLRSYLDNHNTIAEVVALTIRTAAVLGVMFVVEQPMSSMLWSYPAMFSALSFTKASTKFMRMSSFCGSSPKPLVLKTTAPFMDEFEKIHSLRKRRDTHTMQRLATVDTHNGRKRFTGKQKTLKKSSGYTRCMGLAVAYTFAGMRAEDVLSLLPHPDSVDSMDL